MTLRLPTIDQHQLNLLVAARLSTPRADPKAHPAPISEADVEKIVAETLAAASARGQPVADGVSLKGLPQQWLKDPANIDARKVLADLNISPADLLKSLQLLVVQGQPVVSLEALRRAAGAGGAPIMSLDAAMARLREPIQDSFRYDSAGSDLGVYSGYCVEQGKGGEAEGALLALSGALGSPETRQATVDFVKSNKAKVAYWLSYLSSGLESSSTSSCLRQLIGAEAGRSEPHPFAAAFDRIEAVIGPDYLAKAIQALAPRGPKDDETAGDFFGESVVALEGRSVSHELLLSQRFKVKTFNPDVFWQAHRWFGGPTTDLTRLLTELHRAGQVDFGAVFQAALKQYFLSNFSVISGRADEPQDDSFLQLTFETIGPTEMTTRLIEGLMSRSFQGAKDPQRSALEKHAINTLKVDSSDEGALRWSIKQAPAAVRTAVLQWVLDLASKGKDWSDLEVNHEASRNDSRLRHGRAFSQLLRDAVVSHLERDVAKHGGDHKDVWSNLVTAGWVKPTDLEQLSSWATTVLAERAKAIPAPSVLVQLEGKLGLTKLHDRHTAEHRYAHQTARHRAAEATFPTDAFAQLRPLVQLMSLGNAAAAPGKLELAQRLVTLGLGREPALG
jgi:hypothetical protein